MRLVPLLAVGLCVTLLVGGGVAAVGSDVVADPDAETVRPSYLSVTDVALTAESVGGKTATLGVELRLDHRGTTAENVTVIHRAVDLDSGLVETTEETTVDPIDGDREVTVTESLDVSRDSDYRIEALVYHDGQRAERATTEVRGLSTLTPAYAETPVTFHRQSEFPYHGSAEALPPVDYRIDSVDGEQVTLETRAHLTNRGDEPSGDLAVEFRLRQADSNIVAAETAVSIAEVDPGRTEAPTALLTVPDGYDYYIDVVLWNDGVVVGTERGVANLDPDEHLEANDTETEVGLEVSDFETGRDRSAGPERADGADASQPEEQPGFSAITALLAVIVLLSLAALRRHHS